MANYEGIASAVRSVVRLLDACFADDPPVPGTSRAVLVGPRDFDAVSARRPVTGVTLFPFRLDVNRVMRAPWAAVGARDGRAHLPLDLHVLLTAWASTPDDELRILGHAMSCLEATPILSGPLLEGSGQWASNEVVNVVLGEISTEEIMRTFDALPGECYRLSMPYLIRVLRLDSASTPTPDVATAVVGLNPSVPL